MKMAKKKLMVFRLPFGLNNDYGGNFKGGCPPLTGVRRGLCTSLPTQFAVSVIHAHALWWTPEANHVCSWYQHAVGSFACPSSSQKRESTAFDLILRSAWGLSSPGKQVDRSSTPCRKRSQVWGRESEQWLKYMQ